MANDPNSANRLAPFPSSNNSNSISQKDTNVALNRAIQIWYETTQWQNVLKQLPFLP